MIRWTPETMPMVIPELRPLQSPDLPRDREPADPSDMRVFVGAVIGSRDGKGEDLFSFTAVTPAALARESGIRWGRGLLILDVMSWTHIEAAVRKLLNHCSAEDWRRVAEKMNREMHWEFEDYRD